MRYAIIDIEATGGSPKRDKITEIAIFLYDGKRVIDSFCSLINPEIPIPPFISRLTGISNEMVATAPKFYEIAKDIINITKDAIFVAHNVQFDYSYIKSEFKRLGYAYKSKRLCTINLSKKIMPGLTSYGLDNLCKELSIPISNRHRASGDAKATVTLFDLLLQHNGEEHIKETLANYNVYKNLPPNLPATHLDNLPEETGIYYFFNERNKSLYVGKSTDIKRRVLQHMINVNNPSNRKWKMLQQTAAIGFQETGSELLAQLMESYEIKRLRPAFNKAQKNMQYRYGLFSRYNSEGYLCLESKKLASNTKEVPLLFYVRKHQLQNNLNRKIKQYQLCPKFCGHTHMNTGESCLNYQIKLCKGGCMGQESAEQYNRRVKKALFNLTYPYPNFLIIGEGRAIGEQSVVLVERNVVKGYGYYQPEEVLDIQNIKKTLIALPTHPDFDNITRSYLKKNKLDKVVPFNQ